MPAGNFLKNRRLQSASTSVVVPPGSSADRPENPVFGSFRFNTDLGLMEFFDGSVFTPLTPAGNVDIVVDSFTGDGTTATFTMSQSETDAEQVIVFVGSIYQQPTTVYTITGGGSDITFNESPPDNTSINVIHNLGSTVVS